MDVDVSPVFINWRFLAGGLWLTILLSLSSALAATLLGLIVGLAVDKNQPVYVEWLRAVAKSIAPQLEADEQKVVATMQ